MSIIIKRSYLYLRLKLYLSIFYAISSAMCITLQSFLLVFLHCSAVLRSDLMESNHYFNTFPYFSVVL